MKHFSLICGEVFFVDVIAFYLYAEYFHHFVCFWFCRTVVYLVFFFLLHFVVSIVNATYLNPVWFLCTFFIFFVDCI